MTGVFSSSQILKYRIHLNEASSYLEPFPKMQQESDNDSLEQSERPLWVAVGLEKILCPASGDEEHDGLILLWFQIS